MVPRVALAVRAQRTSPWKRAAQRLAADIATNLGSCASKAIGTVQGRQVLAEVSSPSALAAAIRAACVAELPGWAGVPPEWLRVEALSGTSNRNFKVCYGAPKAEGQCVPDTVVFRIRGAGLELLYDSQLEVDIATALSGYGIAPRIYARGADWRIERWHHAVPLHNRSMRDPAIFAQVAQHLGRLHKTPATRADFPSRIRRLPAASLERLRTWGEACERVAAHAVPGSLGELPLHEILAERAWLVGFLLEGDTGLAGSGLDLVFSHGDCQENNILLAPGGLHFIDFEYSGMDHQAFDLASYIIECAIDNLVEQPPFYRVTLSDLPIEDEMHFFCSVYLSEYLETAVQPGSLLVALLVSRVKRFALASHLLWSMWSVVRASQAPIQDFDYLHYGRCRWFLYKWSKRVLLEKL